MEIELLAAIGRTFQNTSSIFQEGRFKQFPEFGEAQRAVACQRLERIDHELNGHHFVAGDRFTIADITALVAIDIGARLADIDRSEFAHLTHWYETVSAVPAPRRRLQRSGSRHEIARGQRLAAGGRTRPERWRTNFARARSRGIPPDSCACES